MKTNNGLTGHGNNVRIVVGVITPYEEYFVRWIRMIGNDLYPKAIFKRISCIEDIRGTMYDKIHSGFKASAVESDAVIMAETRLKDKTGHVRLEIPDNSD